MKALSLTQPWAALVALGQKRIETRSWKTNYSGPIAIHAAKGYPREAKAMLARPEFYEALRAGDYCAAWPHVLGLPLGCVIAIARLEGCRKTEDIRGQLPPKELAFGDYGDHRFAWFLSSIELLPEPVPARGSLGLWEWTR